MHIYVHVHASVLLYSYRQLSIYRLQSDADTHCKYVRTVCTHMPIDLGAVAIEHKVVTIVCHYTPG